MAGGIFCALGGVSAVVSTTKAPCSHIDWITQAARKSVEPVETMMGFWPSPGEVAVTRTQDSSDIFHQIRGIAPLEDAAIRNCLIFENHRPAAATDGGQTSSGPPDRRRERDASYHRNGFARIAIRTSLDLSACTSHPQATVTPTGMVLVRAFPGIIDQQVVFRGLDRHFGARARVDINPFVYLHALISPKRYFKSTHSRYHLIKNAGAYLLVSSYVEPLRDPVSRLNNGFLLMIEVLDVTAHAAGLETTESWCEIEHIEDIPLEIF